MGEEERQAVSGRERTVVMDLLRGEHGSISAPLSDYLAEKGFDMWLESALQIKRCSGIVRTKDDKADSHRIADCALRHYSGKARLHEPDSKALRELRALFSLHNMLTKDKVAKINQIKSGVPDAAPDARNLLERQPALLEEQIDDVDRRLKAMLRDTEEFSGNYRIMDSIKGVGVITACCLIIKTHDFKYMDDAGVFGNFAGVVPSQVEQSGISVDRPRRVIRFRDRETNAVLSQAVNSALTWNPVIREYYGRLVALGVHENKARNNCKFKLINIVMSMIRSRTLFDPDKYGRSRAQWKKAE